MTDPRTAAEVIGDAASNELLDWNGFGLLVERLSDEQIIALDQAIVGVVVARIHAAGHMIVPREPTKAMVLAAIARPDDGASEEGLFYHAIYRAMTTNGELK